MPTFISDMTPMSAIMAWAHKFCAHSASRDATHHEQPREARRFGGLWTRNCRECAHEITPNEYNRRYLLTKQETALHHALHLKK